MADEENKKSRLSLTRAMDGHILFWRDLEEGERNGPKRKFSVSFTLEKCISCPSVGSRWGLNISFKLEELSGATCKGKASM